MKDGSPLFVSETCFVLKEHILAFVIVQRGKRFCLEAVSVHGHHLGVDTYNTIDAALIDLQVLYAELERHAEPFAE